jgi:hypothetical protein
VNRKRRASEAPLRTGRNPVFLWNARSPVSTKTALIRRIQQKRCADCSSFSRTLNEQTLLHDSCSHPSAVISGTTVLGQEAAPQPRLGPAASAVSDEDLNLFHKDIRFLKKQIIALNLRSGSQHQSQERHRSHGDEHSAFLIDQHSVVLSGVRKRYLKGARPDLRVPPVVHIGESRRENVYA